MATGLKIRQIEDSDAPAVVDLLLRGFSDTGYGRPRGFWEQAFACLKQRPVPEGHPRYGYVMESDGKPVGAIILIFATIWDNGAAKVRCNGSGFYVDPAFRFYAPLLAARAQKDKRVTVLNLTAAPHTREMVETTGFTRYSDGIFVAMPLLSPAAGPDPVRILAASSEPDAPFDAHEAELLREHSGYGCHSLWCVTRERAHPFVFRPRMAKLVPCMQLVYCRDVCDFVRLARPIGWHLARKLRPLVILDANGPIPGLVGTYLGGRMPRFYFGPDRPRVGDLAYTEIAMFGV